MWIQSNLKLPPFSRGFHLITSQVLDALPQLKTLKTGLLHIFIQHTSASLTLNENADPEVRVDMEMAISRIVPEDFPYIHTYEGSDDMPAHIKSSMMGSSITVPIDDGRLALGTWQGVYLCEHRDHGGSRRLVLTAFGAPKN